MPESAYLPTVHGLPYGACSLRTTTFDGCEADETTIRLIDDRRAKTPLHMHRFRAFSAKGANLGPTMDHRRRRRGRRRQLA